jgi:glutamyl-tRNA reductase
MGLSSANFYSIRMRMITVGMNHNSAPRHLRGRFSIAPEQLAPALNRFREQMHLGESQPEATLLSTCNRTELYCATDRGHGIERELIRPAVNWLAELGGMSGDKLLAYGYLKEGEQVARHAFRVASGLDSMVLGEPEILGQMKRAVNRAEEAGTLGRNLHQLFQRSFSVAKEVRSTTEIGAHSISMAAASVRLAVQHFGVLRNTRILLVGAGEMIEQVALHFAAQLPASIVVANRTTARAEAVARRGDAER